MALETHENQKMHGLKWAQAVEMLRGNSNLRAFWTEMNNNTDQRNQTVESWNPAILSTQANAEDNPTWEEAMNGPLADGFWEAANTEYQTLKNKEAWEEVDREDCMNVLPGTWAFKVKRHPDGVVKKLKARFCVRGDRQIKNVDYFDTFAPVVNWQTVQIMLTLSLILGLATKQVDYTAAFLHAPIEEEVFVECPRGFATPGKVLKLKRSLYGLKQSPKNFFQHLKKNLEAVGLRSNDDVDPFLFISDKVICLVYVDDTLIFSPKAKWIDKTISALRERDMELKEEDDVAGFLGVKKQEDPRDKSIKLTQTGLIDRIVKALDIGHLPKKYTPAIKEPLTKDLLRDPPQGTYSYASVIGMLQYLQGHPRPDITYAVLQCARFVHSPQRSH